MGKEINNFRRNIKTVNKQKPKEPETLEMKTTIGIKKRKKTYWIRLIVD